jgi:multiple sugar transport system ATP-binding protein
MASVSLKKLTKVYPGAGKQPDVLAVKGIDLEIQDHEFMVLVGPSGCGKSTTLRMLAGLEEISDGECFIGDRLVNDVLPKNRDIAMVFQNYALYPHMTVYDNMAFGLKLQKKPKKEIDERVKEAADILGIEELLERKPKALSGGQRQRVAVGRAIVRHPKVFLFDEPLSNLDAKMRVQMRTELSKLHASLAATMVYVTHDQVEAMTMGDRICVMNGGEIMQVAEPLELYNYPENMFVAGFIGSPPMNFVHGDIQEDSGKLLFVEDSEEETRLAFPLDDRLSQLARPYLGKPIVFGIRPENISDALFVDSSPSHAPIKAKVEVSEPMGSETFLYLTTGKHSLIAKVRSTDRYQINQMVDLIFEEERAHLFDPETENVLK